MFVGIAVQQCPSLHVQCRWVRESTYRRETHRPPRRRASLDISERVALRMAEVMREERLAINSFKPRGIPPRGDCLEVEAELCRQSTRSYEMCSAEGGDEVVERNLVGHIDCR